jgi:Methylamine utilisation protein MauE
MKRTILADIITYFFIILFLYTGIAKIIDIQTFKEQMISSPLMSSLSGFVAWALPIVEILLAIALFIPVTRLKALYVTLGLMSLFTIYVISILFIDNHISCSCGGIIEELTPKQHILFNSACVILGILGILMVRRQQPTAGFRWLTGSSAICLFLVVGWTLFTAFTAPVKRTPGKEGRLVPPFELLLPDSVTRLSAEQIPAGKPFIVFGFDPFCTHCQAETKDIEKHMALFKDIHLYYITPYSFRDMKTFYRYFKVAQYPGITMGYDLDAKFFIYFHVTTVPFVAIYDSHKRLKEVFQNSTSVEQLLQAAAE